MTVIDSGIKVADAQSELVECTKKIVHLKEHKDEAQFEYIVQPEQVIKAILFLLS